MFDVVGLAILGGFFAALFIEVNEVFYGIVIKKEAALRLSAVFVIEFVWVLFYLYVSCKEQNLFRLFKCMWPALIVITFMYVIFFKRPVEAKRVLWLTGISICFSALVSIFGATQNLVYVNDTQNMDISSTISSAEVCKKINAELGDFEKNFKVDSSEIRVIKNKPIVVYHIRNISIIRNKIEYIPGYVILNEEKHPELVVKNIRFDKSYINDRDALRTVRRKYPTLVFGESKFDIDDNMNPYQIYCYREVFNPSSTEDCEYGLVILNLVDGSSKKYNANNIPQWVDFKSTYPR